VAQKEPLIVITGPTCSVKTACALELAERFPVEVVSADSMQVYRHMDIATAKPSLRERAALPHHVLDVVNPDEEFNAAVFAALANAAVRDIRARGKIPLVVGGTGLYIKVLIHGLVPAPPGSPALRKAMAALIRRRGIAFLEAMLARLDPVAASRIMPNDAARTVRFLEIVLLTGRRIGTNLREHAFRDSLFDARIACIMPERESLFRSIDARAAGMFENGLIEETSRLIALGYGPRLRSMQTLAYRHVTGLLDGALTLDECMDLVRRDTRRFAKRQITWMRAQKDHVFFDSTALAANSLARWIERYPAGGCGP